MIVFSCDEKKEKLIARKTAKYYDRYKKTIKLTYIGLIVLLIGVLYSVYLMYSEGVLTDSLIMSLVLILGINLLTILFVLITYLIAISGGRDVLKCRLNQKIALYDDRLVVTYTPKYRQVENFELMEITIYYKDIVTITYSKSLCKTTILSTRYCEGTMWLRFGRAKDNIKNWSNDNWNSDFFDSMVNVEEFKKVLQRLSGIEIIEN